MAKARKKAAPAKKRGKRGRGRPLGFKCSAATRAKMKKSALARWRGHKSSKRKAAPAKRRVARRKARR